MEDLIQLYNNYNHTSGYLYFRNVVLRILCMPLKVVIPDVKFQVQIKIGLPNSEIEID